MNYSCIFCFQISHAVVLIWTKKNWEVVKVFVLLHQVNEPIPKLEGQSQCSGEAEYINDIPNFPGELSAYYVLASVGNCDLDTVDASAALVTFC